LAVNVPDMVPALEDPLSQEERQKRVLLQFLRVFAQQRMIVLFMDDLQWSSESDMQLLAGLVQDFAAATMTDCNRSTGSIYSILLICAYRDNSVGQYHHVRTLFEDKIVSDTIEITPLRQEDTEQLVSDTLHQPLEECRAISKLIHLRSRGNPFFIERVLSQMT